MRVICVTNAPINFAAWRLKHLKIYNYFYGLAGRESVKPKSRLILWMLNDDELKPSPNGYKKILQSLHSSIDRVYVIGDSLNKDIQPALVIGATTIYARYGKACDPKNLETVRQVTTLPGDKTAIDEKTSLITPAFTIDSFSQVRELVTDLPQSVLPGL